MKHHHLALAAAVALGLACDGGSGPTDPGGVALTQEELLDPENCESCHPVHYREWASSMHAYAAEDPVFIAMNERGQEETGGALGDFCVQCHAPMALIKGATTDGLNLDEVPKHLKGVTCYYCHNAVAVQDTHNNPIILANDDVMRGGIRDPVEPAAHRAAYSELHDRNSLKSSELCGACHDIVTPPPRSVHLERTFAEYQASVFATAPPGQGRDTCQGCHMPRHPEDGVAADDPNTNVPLRRIHSHLWPGVDVALTDFPDIDVQRRAIECELTKGVQLFSLEQVRPLEFEVMLESEAGHNAPSGASQDRRMWVEFIAYDGGDVIFASGDIADDESELEKATLSDSNRRARMFRDHIYDEEGNEVHMFWEAARVESNTLPARSTLGTFDHAVPVTYSVPRMPTRITVRTRIRPMGFDVLQHLIDSEHLGEDVLRAIPTFTIATGSGEWTPEMGLVRAPKPEHCEN